MVLYFSATGNTEFIAKEIARRLDDECLNLIERIKKDDHTELSSDKPFVICTPVYVCELPRFLRKYLNQQVFLGSRDIYFIFTSGGYAGISGPMAKKIVRKKKMNYLGHAEFTMPRNYVASDMYDMLGEEEITNRIRTAYGKIPEVVSCIKNRQMLKARHVFFFEKVITVPFNPVWTKIKQPAKDFFANESCIGCGKCVSLCPLNNIELKDKKPVWKNPCAHCMACIGNCPVEAIEYGNITQKKEKYNFAKYKKVISKEDQSHSDNSKTSDSETSSSS